MLHFPVLAWMKNEIILALVNKKGTPAYKELVFNANESHL